MANSMVLTLLLLLPVAQFKPDPKFEHPTIDGFRDMCVDQLKVDNAIKRLRIERFRPSRSRTQAVAAWKSFDADMAELDATEQPGALIPVKKLLVNVAKVGDVGAPVQLKDRDLAVRLAKRKTFLTNEDIEPAMLEVLETVDDNTLRCKCLGSEFFLCNYTGPAVVDHTTFELKGVYVVSGIYKHEAKSLIAIEPWAHNDAEWWRNFRVPPKDEKTENEE